MLPFDICQMRKISALARENFSLHTYSNALSDIRRKKDFDVLMGDSISVP